MNSQSDMLEQLISQFKLRDSGLPSANKAANALPSAKQDGKDYGKY